MSVTFTIARKAGGGLLSKRITLGDDGKPVSDGSPCRMWAGTARRVTVAGPTEVAEAINGMDGSEAVILGIHLAEADQIRLAKDVEADPAKGIYGRTTKTFRYPEGQPGLILLDHDKKGMPEAVAARIDELGGPVAAIGHLLGGLEQFARVYRPSTSSGIYNKVTGEKFQAGGGFHLYLIAADVSDSARFLRALQARALRAGLGWGVIMGRGRFGVRSVIDIMVGSPERLAFEGNALVVHPLAQDLSERAAIAYDGAMIDTRAVCPDPTPEEAREVAALIEAERRRLKPEEAKAKEAAAVGIAEKRGITVEKARIVVAASDAGELVSYDSVIFDDPELGEVEVADILADPDRYHGETLSDPLEGPEYGTGKAQIYSNGGGDVRIHSFAHGSQRFKLGHSFDFISIEVDKAGENAVERLAELLPAAATLTPVQRERLIAKASTVAKVGRKAVKDTIGEALSRAGIERAERRARRARAEAGLDDADNGAATSSGTTNRAAGDPFAEFHAAVDRVNRDFFVCQFAGAVPICTFHHDPELKRRHLAFMKPADFRLKFLTETYLVGFKRDGGELWKDLGTGWMECKRRRQYDRAGMFPRGDAPPGTLNLWQGWGVVPAAGSWDTIAWHLLRIICNGDQELCDYLIGLLAYWVQNPEKVGEVAVVLRGRKGTGKGTLADVIRAWFRHHSVHITQPRHLTGNFNAHLADCLFLFADEVTWGGDKPGEGALKGLITEKTIQIEPKGINCFSLRNRIKVLIASNSDWVVPVTEDERRFLVLDVNDATRGNRKYFDKLHAAIENGEAAAFLHDLLTLDISGFDYRTVPHTDGLNAQKVEGLDSVARWWMSCLDEGRIVGGPAYENGLGEVIGSAHWPGEMGKARLHYAYLQHCQAHGERHPKAENAFPRAWARYAPSVTQYKPVGAPRRWQFQGLAHHRAEFLKAMKIDSWSWGQVDEHGEDKDDNVTPFPGKEA
jgi:hypothetical protein